MFKRIFSAAILVVVVFALAVTAAASTDPPAVGITSEMLTPIFDAVTGNIAVVLPVAIGIFGIMIGINLIWRLIHRATAR